MNATPRPAADLIIVDRRPGDYAKLIHDAEASLLDVYFFSSGEAALRATCAASSTVWMINTRLPDVAGVDLLQEISRRSRKSVVYLVGDAYSPQEELAAHRRRHVLRLQAREHRMAARLSPAAAFAGDSGGPGVLSRRRADVTIRTSISAVNHSIRQSIFAGEVS